MADLRYSLELLSGLGRELTSLADALDGTARRTSWDAEDVGHRLVADALDGFAGSWDDRRELLTRALRAVGAMATESAATFQDVDDQLAAEIRAVLEPR
ncbi:hypothetical protein [Blastococcus sp. CCUG 61487]|uniref:hypothetical protein n=1 Tax=Blastococcus sp. CCUG 61487 TaxID=1840703 RepID=UPI0010BFC6DD|nr:hypothetical protein [Blastococcus sp. CCUG 61487]TKJ34220.1 hypothetical protein A6V29_15260 [Blastococcus sp. CCUG 61487]